MGLTAHKLIEVDLQVVLEHIAGMKRIPTLTQDRFREVLTFEIDTGVFRWAVSRGKASVGKVAGKLRETGRVIGIDGKNYSAASLAWFWVNGEWPARLLRFKDGNRDNVTVSNLVYGKHSFVDRAGKTAYLKEWRSKNPRNARYTALKCRVGVDLHEYQRMFVECGGVCSICKKPETGTHKGKPVWLSVDHDHADGTIRGLLCHRCNHMLGHAKDNVETLRAGAAYLEAHAAKPKTNVIPLSARRASNKGD